VIYALAVKTSSSAIAEESRCRVA